MKRTKNVLSILIVILLCILCIICIVFLNKEQMGEKELKLDEYEKKVYSAYSKIILEKQDIRVTEQVSGIIQNMSDDLYCSLKYIGSLKEMKFSQGERFHTNDLIYKTNTGGYKAKFNGIIDRILINGKNVSITLVNCDNRYVETYVPIELLKYIKLNQTIEFIYAAKTYEGKVGYISNVAENDCARVEIEFVDDKFEVLTNASVQVVIEKEVVKSALAVPKEALIKSGEEYYLRIDDGSESGELTRVTTGIESDEGDIEIRTGIDEDDIVMVDLNANLYGEGHINEEG